jgi:phosphoribosylformimino-5-aminoimidazole carboxamide ribotide isomerase
VDAGAGWLHVVDLDGARDGAPANLQHLERIAGELGAQVQFGGGLRSTESIRAALNAGAARVLVGTAAITDPDLLGAALEEWGERVAVAVDVRGGRVSVSAWTEETELTAEQLIECLQETGAERFVYTNADRDGMLEGVDLDEVRRIAAAVRGRFTISGGVGSLADLTALRDARLPTLEGVISGKALYERRFTVEEALRTLDGAA